MDDLKNGLTDKFGFVPNLSSDQNDSSTIIFEYPKAFRNDSIKSVVVIEAGSLSAKGPVVEKVIQPMVATDFLRLFPCASFSVRCLDPRRIFWEKITIIYREAKRPASKSMPPHYSRHFYDVYQLRNSEYYQTTLQSKEIFYDVLKMKQTFFSESWLNYYDAKDAMPLALPDYRLKEFEKDYKSMSMMFYGKYPSIQELQSTLLGIESDLNVLNKKK